MVFNIIKNSTLLVACYISVLWRGWAKKANTQPQRIVVMPASRLGDMVCATPIFHAIKQTYISSEVIVVGLATCAAIHENNTDVDAYVSLSPTRILENIKKIKALHADVAVLTSPNFESVVTFFLAGVKTIIGPNVINGFSPYQTKSYRLMMPLFIAVEHRMRYYAPLEYLKMLEPIGIMSTDTTKHVGFSSESKLKIESILKGKGINFNTDLLIGISISAGNTIKKWPGEKFSALADKLATAHRAMIIFVGSPSDVSETINAIGRLNSSTRFINMTGACTIDELKALISFMDLFISVDTGPIYIAEALNIPTVDITGPIDENEQPPIGEFHKVVHADDRAGPELFVMNARTYNRTEAQRQVDVITVDAVFAAANELIGKTS